MKLEEGSQIKNKCVLGNGSENLGRVGSHIFTNYYLFWKKYNFMHFERQDKLRVWSEPLPLGNEFGALRGKDWVLHGLLFLQSGHTLV